MDKAEVAVVIKVAKKLEYKLKAYCSITPKYDGQTLRLRMVHPPQFENGAPAGAWEEVTIQVNYPDCEPEHLQDLIEWQLEAWR